MLNVPTHGSEPSAHLLGPRLRLLLRDLPNLVQLLRDRRHRCERVALRESEVALFGFGLRNQVALPNYVILLDLTAGLVRVREALQLVEVRAEELD